MYEQYYQLSGKPFRLSPDPKFFFASTGHKRALAYLQYGLSQGEGFVVITGKPGTGKTTLVKRLLADINPRELVAASVNTTQIRADELLKLVAMNFGLSGDFTDKAEILSALERLFQTRHRENKRCVLIVDEAQNLPSCSVEELRMLSNFQDGDNALLQTFLIGQEQFRTMIESPDLEQLNQRVIANYHLHPLDEQESESYIRSRLLKVNWNNDPEISADAFAALYECTQGVPRRINTFCDRLFLYSFLEELHLITADTVIAVADELNLERSVKKPLPGAETRPPAMAADPQPASVDAPVSSRNPRPAQKKSRPLIPADAEMPPPQVVTASAAPPVAGNLAQQPVREPETPAPVREPQRPRAQLSVDIIETLNAYMLETSRVDVCKSQLSQRYYESAVNLMVLSLADAATIEKLLPGEYVCADTAALAPVAANLLRQMFIDVKKDLFWNLGLPGDADSATVRLHYNILTHLVSGGINPGQDERQIPVLNKACSTLLNPMSRHQYMESMGKRLGYLCRQGSEEYRSAQALGEVLQLLVRDKRLQRSLQISTSIREAEDSRTAIAGEGDNRQPPRNTFPYMGLAAAIGMMGIIAVLAAAVVGFSRDDVQGPAMSTAPAHNSSVPEVLASNDYTAGRVEAPAETAVVEPEPAAAMPAPVAAAPPETMNTGPLAAQVEPKIEAPAKTVPVVDEPVVKAETAPQPGPKAKQAAPAAEKRQQRTVAKAPPVTRKLQRKTETAVTQRPGEKSAELKVADQSPPAGQLRLVAADEPVPAERPRQPQAVVVRDEAPAGTREQLALLHSEATEQTPPRPSVAERPASVADESLNARRIETFLQDFRRAWGSGDLERVLDLFDEDVRTENFVGKRQLARVYRRRLADEEQRRIVFANMKWQYHQDSASGQGRIELGSAQRPELGDLKIRVQRIDDQLLITEYYVQARQAQLEESSQGRFRRRPSDF